MAQALKKEKKPHALDDLVPRVGKANPKLLESVLEDTSNDELVATGASIATARLVTDGVRLYGEALDFLDEASPVQKKLLRGASRPFLAVAVHHLDALRTLEAGSAEKSQGKVAERIVVDETARAATANAVAMRDQAFDALRDAAGRDKTLRAQVEAAFGTADDAEALATGIDATAGLLTKWLASGSAALRTRLELANLDKEYAAELTDAARDVRAAAATAAKRTSHKATQAALDREDGVQILLLGQIIRAFEGAHGRDATIPRLVPISARRLFNRNTRKPAAEAVPAADARPPA